jgi:hypothetical protein
MIPIKKRLEMIIPKLQSESLLQCKGQGGEISFYIFDYDPKDELLVRDYIRYFLQQFNTSDSLIRPIEFDLYLLMMETLKRRNVLDRVELMEEREGCERVFKAIKSVVQPENIIQIIQERMADHNLVLLTGIGKVWPFVRSHTILNNLHHVLDTVPVVMFFPGVYDQTELRLFNKFKDDNYYRAFKLIDDSKGVCK